MTDIKTKKPRAATRERLLAAAEIEFAMGGFDGAKLADIARRIGIRRPSLLYHFCSKAELYKATVERAFWQLGETLGLGMTAQGSFEDRLRSMTTLFTDFLEQRPFLARLIIREILTEQGPGRDILISRVVPLLDMVEDFIRKDGQEVIRGDLPVRAAVMQSASNILMKNASGSLQRALWGPGDYSWPLTRFAFFEAKEKS